MTQTQEIVQTSERTVELMDSQNSSAPPVETYPKYGSHSIWSRRNHTIGHMHNIYLATHDIQPMGHSGYFIYPMGDRGYFGYQGTGPSVYISSSFPRYPIGGAPGGGTSGDGDFGRGLPGGGPPIGYGGFPSGGPSGPQGPPSLQGPGGSEEP